MLEAVEQGCDGLFLDLHGAMVTESFDDGEGELLARVRTAAPDLPIAVALDFHTNLSARMVEKSAAERQKALEDGPDDDDDDDDGKDTA